MNALTLTPVDGEPRVDSRLIAGQLGIEHESACKILKQYQTDFEQLGVFRFEIGKPPKGSFGGRPEKYALLNEDQAYLLLTYSQNTPQARALKIRLVRAFGDYRRGTVPPAIEHPLPDIPLRLIGGEPRVSDLALADYLGFPYPARIRPLIRRNQAKLQRFGIIATVAKIHGAAGRPANEFYLNQKQAVWVCMKSETDLAFDVQAEIVRVFDAYLLGDLKPVTNQLPYADPPNRIPE